MIKRRQTKDDDSTEILEIADRFKQSTSAFTLPVIVVCIAIPILLVLQGCFAVGLPFETNNAVNSLLYWIIIFCCGLPCIPYIFFILGAATQKLPLVITSLVCNLITICWYLFGLVIFFIVFATCQDNIPCASNLTADGIIMGPYHGARPRFIMIVCTTTITIFGLFLQMFSTIYTSTILKNKIYK